MRRRLLPGSVQALIFVTEHVREKALIQWLAEHPTRSAIDVVTGIGDDAAVLRNFKDGIVVTTDLICDGTHFLSEECTPTQIGRKALAVNLSDIAAMAAKPVAAFVSLLLPHSTCSQYATELMTGITDLANEFDCSLAGGDTNTWSGRLAINVTLIGRVTERGPLLRSGAKPNDVLLVSGALGGSIAGHHLRFTPRIREALLLHEKYQLNAGMDLSDGLALDLRRMCEASACGAEVKVGALPVSEAARKLAGSEREAIQRCLGDGEDFELLLAVPPEDAKRILSEQPLDGRVHEIGHCTEDTQIWMVHDGTRSLLPELGYEHGRQDG